VYRDVLAHIPVNDTARANIVSGIKDAIGRTPTGLLKKFHGREFAVTILVDGVVLYGDAMYEKHARDLIERLSAQRARDAKHDAKCCPKPPPGEPEFDDDAFVPEV